MMVVLTSCEKKLNKEEKAIQLQGEALRIVIESGQDKDSVEYAFQLLKEAHELLPLDNKIINHYMSRFYLYEKRYDSARYYLWVNLKNSTTSAESYTGIGITFECEEKQDSAVYYYQKAYDLYGNRIKKNEMDSVADFFKQAFMLILINNNPQQGIKFLSSKKINFSDTQTISLIDSWCESLSDFDRNRYFDVENLLLN